MTLKKKEGGKERRKYIRYACRADLKTIIDFNPDVALRSRCRLPLIEFRRGEKGTITNIGQKGIAIELEHILAEGMTLKIAIENPITPPIQTGVRVVWAKEASGRKKGYAMGMVFRYMSEKHKRNLDRLIEFLQSIPQ